MLTTAQLATLKADLAANTNTVLINGTPTAINAVPQTADNAFAVAAWYSQAASPSYFVVRTDAPVVDIENNITWPNYTPNPAVTSGNAAQATACAMYCQGKQFNLQLLLQKTGQSTFDATKATATAGLKDATSALPAGANFANQTGGWTNIMPILSRAALNIEKLLVAGAASALVPALYDGSSAQGAAGNPSVMGYQGSISFQDVQAAWAA